MIEFKKDLDRVGIPVAYFRFKRPTTVPFMVYYESGEDSFAADDENYFRNKVMTVELYTAKKDLKTENLVEQAFNKRYFTKNGDQYLDSEQLFLIRYEVVL